MNILWVTWKDKKHPAAGGAEVLNEEHAKRLAKSGHKVILLVGGYSGGKHKEMIDDYQVIRVGNKWTVYWEAYKYYKNYLASWPDLIIEEINTMPFMTQWYAREKRVLYIYQLCREIWFYEIFFPLNLIGYFLEPIYLWILRKNTVFTESVSTKKDLIKYGFKPKNIHIIPVGISLKPISDLNKPKKYMDFTLLSFGAIRSMKQTNHQLEAFTIAKKTIPSLKLKIAGQPMGDYGQQFLKKIAESPYKNDIEYLGAVTEEKKRELMQKSHVVLVTSVKEGWGLVVTEAASQGTPAIVYNSDGLRDSVIHKKTGIICTSNKPKNLAHEVISIAKNSIMYRKLQINSYHLNKKFNFVASYVKFKNSLKI